jgi:hypothetical protein
MKHYIWDFGRLFVGNSPEEAEQQRQNYLHPKPMEQPAPTKKKTRR